MRRQIVKGLDSQSSVLVEKAMQVLLDWMVAGDPRQSCESAYVSCDFMLGANADTEYPCMEQCADHCLDGFLDGLLPLGDCMTAAYVLLVCHETLRGLAIRSRLA